ncbi:hypothetical protein Tco_0714900 [Tanacetum coccineum]
MAINPQARTLDVYLRPLIMDLIGIYGQISGVRRIDVATGQKLNIKSDGLWTIAEVVCLGGWGARMLHEFNVPNRNGIALLHHVKEDPDVIHVDNSSDLSLSTRLNDLEIVALHIHVQSIYVDAPPDIIDVDKDDDIIDEEDPIPHDLADSDDEDLIKP